MIFLTVGSQFGFDRLVKAVDDAIEKRIIEDTVFAQIGPGDYLPRQMDYVVALEKDQFDQTLRSCQAMISHAGMGNIELALKQEKPLLVMPRLKQYGEVVNNHQIDTAQKFEQLGHILAVYRTEELPEKIKQLKHFVPQPRNPNLQGILDRIELYLYSLCF